MALLVGIDPGNTTGIAFGAYPADDKPYDPEFTYQAGVEQYFEFLKALSTEEMPITVVCESFTLQRGRPMSSDQISPTYLIGALQYLAYVNRDITLVMQTPAAAKEGVKDKHLEKLGLLQTPKTKWNHANDAMRHVVQYLKSIGHMPTLEGGFK